MHPEEIRRLLDAQPFMPLRICVSDGGKYELHDRVNAFVWQRQLILGVGAERNELPRRSVYLDPIHVTRIEPIINGDTPPHNGAR